MKTVFSVCRIDTKSAVRSCGFSFDGNMAAFSTDRQMGHDCIINVVDVREFDVDKPIMTLSIPQKGPKVTSMVWGTLDQQIITGHDNGDIVQWDLKTHQKVKMSSHHEKSISDIQLSKDRKYLRFLKPLLYKVRPAATPLLAFLQ